MSCTQIIAQVAIYHFTSKYQKRQECLRQSRYGIIKYAKYLYVCMYVFCRFLAIISYSMKTMFFHCWIKNSEKIWTTETNSIGVLKLCMSFDGEETDRA